jgi:ELWxxDGT repeat protein
MLFLLHQDIHIALAQQSTPYPVLDSSGLSLCMPVRMIGAQDILYFAHGPSDTRLVRTDGTPSGTFLLKQFGLMRTSLDLVATIGNTLFFFAEDASHGRELWKSDGTVEGTMLVKDILPGEQSGAGVSSSSNSTVMNGIFYFVGPGGELWRSDGTDIGTHLVKDIIPDDNTTPNYGLQWLIGVNGILYLSAYHPDYGREIWRSDGTSAGTTIVKDINPAKTDLFNVLVGAVDSGVLFIVSDNQLWKSDGTAAGTVFVQTVDPGYVEWTFEERIGTSNKFYFAFRNFNGDQTLWVTDGSAAGTHKLKESAGSFRRIGDTVLFGARTEATGSELWKTDGTVEGTILVKDIYPGERNSYLHDLTPANGLLYFYATTEAEGVELWRSDGTETGTTLFADLLPGPEGSGPDNGNRSIGVANNLLYFAADDGGNRCYRLWALNLSRPYVHNTLLPMIGR